jgi:hypothetical protein
MKNRLESELYPSVASWLSGHLRDKFPKATVTTHDTHSSDLSAFLRRRSLQSKFSDCDAYEIQVDVTGLVEADDFVKLAFVECKLGPVTLGDVGQLLGYSLVARPEWAYLISPAGMSDRLSALLVTYGRQDVLSYGGNKHIRVARWNIDRKEIDLATLIPKGMHI